jgi:hypothetical protein
MNPIYRAILAHIRETSQDPKLLALTDEELIRYLFCNHRGQHGLRLTAFGLQVLQGLFTAYDIKMPADEVVLPKHLICLDRTARLPYYFDKQHIVVFDSEFGIKLRLVNGRLATLMEIEAA